MGWEEALLCDVQAKQNEVLEEMECREWTDDDEDSIPSTPCSSFWWVESLLGAAATIDLDIPTDMPTVRILSACSGACAEGEVMKAHDVSLTAVIDACRNKFVFACRCTCACHPPHVCFLNILTFVTLWKCVGVVRSGNDIQSIVTCIYIIYIYK